MREEEPWQRIESQLTLRCTSDSQAPLGHESRFISYWNFYAGIPFEEIVTKYYPDLTIDDVKAGLKYAMDIVRAEEIHLAATS